MFDSYENDDYIEEVNIGSIVNYICMNLNSWSPNHCYWQKQYHIVTKLCSVCRWRRENGARPIGKKGEIICNNELVNFFANEKHRYCSCSRV